MISRRINALKVDGQMKPELTATQ